MKLPVIELPFHFFEEIVFLGEAQSFSSEERVSGSLQYYRCHPLTVSFVLRRVESQTPHLFSHAKQSPTRPRSDRLVPPSLVTAPALSLAPHHYVLAGREDPHCRRLVPDLILRGSETGGKWSNDDSNEEGAVRRCRLNRENHQHQGLEDIPDCC